MALHLSILALIIILSFIFENKIRSQKVLAALSDGGDFHFKSELAPWLILFGVFTFLACVRTNVNDTDAYRYFFEILKPSWDNVKTILQDDSKDKGFYIFQNIFKMYISDNYHVWFLFFAVVESAILVHVFRTETVSFADSMFFFFASTLYINYFSMMRQWFAVCLVFLGSTFIKRGKFIPYLLLCLFAAQFHNSAYIMIAVYFLVQSVAWGKRQIAVIIAFVIAMLFLQPILNSMESSGGTYDYVATAMTESAGASIFRPIIAIVPVVFAFRYREKIDVNDKMINVCINMALINFLVNIVAVFTGGLYMVRLATYINLYNVILYPYLLNVVLKDDKNQSIIKPAFYIFFFMFYFYEMNNSGFFYYYSDIIGRFK